MSKLHHHSSTALFAAAALAAIALAPEAARAQAPSLSRGSVLLSGQASFDVEDYGGDGGRLTSLVLLPAAQYFVRGGLALGGELHLMRRSSTGWHAMLYGIGPAASYYFVQDGSLHPFVRGSVRVVEQRVTRADDTSAARATVFGMRGAAGVLLLLSEGVGIDFGLYYDRLH